MPAVDTVREWLVANRDRLEVAAEEAADMVRRYDTFVDEENAYHAQVQQLRAERAS